ncbi:MAG: OsmC family protein [Actinomycetota bacterium]|jgi:putative redox protein|nr:OsmC family protein [Actinomycetota bacterium]
MTRSCFSLDMDTFDQTREAIRQDPKLGQGSFSTVTEWVDGSLARTTARSFTIETDEPAPLGGTDQAIDPMELLLAAVGTCLQIGWVTHANRRGIDFRSLRIETQGDYDLQGYLGLDPGVPPGYLNISYSVEVDTDADPGVLEEIRVAAENGSPVTQNVLKGTSIRSEIKRL